MRFLRLKIQLSYLNRLNLTPEQVDALISAGRELLRNHPQFKRLLADLN